MLDDIRHATARRRAQKASQRLQLDCRRLLRESAGLNGMAIASELVDRIEDLDDEQLDGFFAWLASELSPDPAAVLRAAEAYAQAPQAQTLLPEMPAAIAPLIDKKALPLPPERFRVAAFYSISNCEPGLRGVSLGNFLIKTVALQLQRELPQFKRFCTLSPIPGFARWLLAEPELAALPGLKRGDAAVLEAARARLLALSGGELGALQGLPLHERMEADDVAALTRLANAYLTHLSPTPGGDPVARFHLDNGARLERLNPRGHMSPAGLKQSFGMMANYLYDLDKVEAHHGRFRAGEVVRSRELAAAP